MNTRKNGPADIQQSIEKNNLKLSADKILQGLKKVRNEPSKSRRRWVWELLQNAKDVPNVFGRVKVRVSLTGKGLAFAHNGDPFTSENITGLIQQVSTKASGGDDEEVTGKFGTGFISTHLLSEKVQVSGITLRPKGVAKRFIIELDRSGRNSEELMPHIEATIDRIKGIDDDEAFETIDNYTASRREHDLDTELTYHFSSKAALTTAQVGLDDLRNTLPFTLANVPKIEEVVVVDTTRKFEVTYTCVIVREEDNLREVSVTITTDGKEDTVYIICWDGDGVTLMAQVEDLEEYALIPNFGKHPTLYRQFPLIGSEKFFFPFMLNGEAFFPTEERDGLQLNSEEDEDSLANREIIAKAMDEAVEFAEWLIEHGCRNRFVIANTRIPDVHWEPEALEWYKGLQGAWRKRIRDLALVENSEAEPIVLKDAWVPKYGNSKEVKEEFWERYAPFKGYGVVPRKDLLHAWIEALGPQEQLDSWGTDIALYFDLEDMLSDIANAEKLEKIELNALPPAPLPDRMEWLVSILQFAIDQEESDLLDQYAVVPNQNGDLKKLEDLYKESVEEPIPDEILDVMAQVGIQWRSNLIDRRVRLEGMTHETRGIRDASDTLNELLTKEKKNAQGQFIEHFLLRDDARSVLLELLSIVPPGTKDSLRHRLLRRAAELFDIEAGPKKVERCAKFDFSPAMRLLIETMHDELEEFGTVSTLATRLNVEEEEAIQWLDGHLLDLDGNTEFRSWLEYGSVIPSRTYALCAHEDLLNYGTDETPLNDTLLNVLKGLDPEKDQYPNLLADGIGIHLPNTLTLAELGASIQECVKLIRADLAKGDVDADTVREPLLDLINWCEHHEDEARIYLGGFMPEKDSLFFSLVARGNLGSGVIKMLGNAGIVAMLKQIDDNDLEYEEVSELLALGGALGSLNEVIRNAKELLEEKQDFEYKKELGERMEQVLKEALDAEGFQTEVQGIGSYDISVTNPANGKVFYIELKSSAIGSSESLRLAPSQAMAWRTDAANRALCLIERGTNGSTVSIDYVKQKLRTRNALANDLVAGNNAYNKFHEVMNGQELEIQLLGEVRVKLSRAAYLKGAGGYEQLIQAIRAALT